MFGHFVFIYNHIWCGLDQAAGCMVCLYLSSQGPVISKQDGSELLIHAWVLPTHACHNVIHG